MRFMNEVLSNNIEDSQKEPWYYRYNILIGVGIFISPRILSFWIPTDIAWLIVLGGFANLYFFLPPRTTWLHTKFGNGVKGFFIINLLVAIYYCGMRAIIYFVDTLIPEIPLAVKIVMIPLTFFFICIYGGYWIIKSTKK